MAKKKVKVKNGTVNEVTIEVPYTIPAQEVLVSVTIPTKDIEELLKAHKKGK